MGLEEVVSDIEATGTAAAEAILREAEDECRAILSEAGEKARRLLEERLRQADRTVSQLRVQELSGAELEVRRARLAMERDLLEAAAAGARQRVAGMAPGEDEALLLDILRRRGEPGYRIHSARRNEAFLRANSPAPYAGNIDCLGGLLLESPDGSVRVDLTYDTVLREAVERSIGEVHGILFPR